MRLASEVRPNELQRNDAIDQHVTRAIHDSHPAATDLPHHAVGADPAPFDFAGGLDFVGPGEEGGGQLTDRTIEDALAVVLGEQSRRERAANKTR